MPDASVPDFGRIHATEQGTFIATPLHPSASPFSVCSGSAVVVAVSHDEKVALLGYRIGVSNPSTVHGRSNAMRQFLQHHGEQILGVLSGFDRLRLRGTLRIFASEGGGVSGLQQAGIALKDFLTWAEGLTQRLRRRTEQEAQRVGRPVQYLDRFVDKEAHVAKIRAERGVADNGLVTVLSTLETCRSFELHRCRGSGHCELRRKVRNCLHYSIITGTTPGSD